MSIKTFFSIGIQPSNLLQVQLFERVELWAGHVFIHELRLYGVPPSIVGIFQFRDHSRILQRDIALFPGIGLCIEKLPFLPTVRSVANKVVPYVPYAAEPVL